jgi:hypothetical protein
MTSRFLKMLALLWAAAALLLLLTDALVVRDEALVLAASGLLAGSAVFGILLIPPIDAQSDDPWAKVAWGKFFVAIVYASIAAACLVAMAHTPDAARWAHALRAAL